MNMENEYGNTYGRLATEVEGLVKRMAPDAPEALGKLLSRAIRQIGEGDVCLMCQPEEMELLKGWPLLCGSGADEQRPFVLKGERLYTRRNFFYEEAVRTRLDKMAMAKSDLPDFTPAGQLSDEQMQALERIASRRFNILSGGPGTGKTYTIAQAIAGMQAAAANGVKVRLCAPTAKAARRLMESIGLELCRKNGIEATTVHSLLGATPDLVTFRHNRDNPLDLDWLIVDEVSMLGLPMLAKLLDALPEKCSLTLAGDKDQLASVERGSVFADLCRRYNGALSLLTVSRRFPPQSPVARLAKVINAGDVVGTLNELGQGPLLYVPLDDLRIESACYTEIAYHTERWPEFDSLVKKGMAAFAAATTPEEAGKHLDDFRILCALRQGPYGVEYMNSLLLSLFPNAPVPWMITRNDNELGVYNGTIVIEMPDKPQVLYLLDDQGKVMNTLSASLLPARELAYAITVHKSQGSEYQHVCLVLPEDGKSPILTREILYTAITRTRNDVSIFGGWAAVATAVDRQIQRTSGL